MSIEQMCRNLLDRAIADGLVRFCPENFGGTTEPQQLTAGDICGVANLLTEYLRKAAWIPVEERLPDHHHDVLVAFHDKMGPRPSVYVGHFERGAWKVDGCGPIGVTHWTEKPEPPPDGQ